MHRLVLGSTIDTRDVTTAFARPRFLPWAV